MNISGSSEDAIDADLGLGNGLKPGARTCDPADPKLLGEEFEKCKVSYISDSHISGQSDSDDSEEEIMALMPIGPIQELKAQYSYLIPRSSRSTEVNSVSADDNYFYDGRYFPQRSQAELTCAATKCACRQNGCKQCQVTPTLEFPVYADVPYGTSLRQQRQLFSHNIEEIKKKKDSGFKTDNMISKPDEHASPENHTSEEIALKLAATLQEVEDLKAELEACEQKLDSKYKAIDILRRQAEEAQQRLRRSEVSSQQTNKKLAQEISELQYEISCRENTLTDCQQVWVQRFERTSIHKFGMKRVNIAAAAGGGNVTVSSFDPGDLDLGDLTSCSMPRRYGNRETKEKKPKMVSVEKFKRMCEENKSLGKLLESRTDELRKMTARAMAAERENDELLALLDVQERAKYEESKTSGLHNNYNTISSSELAILGACRCRVSNPEPCGCALAAANLKKLIQDMKSEVLQYKARRDEAYHTVDAYRLAFEEQLQKNKALTQQLANLSVGRNSNGSFTGKSKARLALRWLIGSLNDEELDEEGPGPCMSETELISYLTEMLNEKKEVLAHQKLAAQILGDRVKVLEAKLAQHERDGVDSGV